MSGILKFCRLPSLPTSRLRFLIYAGLVGWLINWVIQTSLLPPTAGERRDTLFFLLMPFVFEFAFFLACLITWIIAIVLPPRFREKDSTSTPFGVSVTLLNQIPIILSCWVLLSLETIGWASVGVVLAIGALQLTWIRYRQFKSVAAMQWIAGLIVIVPTIKTTLLVAPKCPFHWSHYLAPLSAYREGGILLWDTPSAYGFLNIILASIVASLFRLQPATALSLLLVVFSLLTLGLVFWILYRKLSFAPFIAACFSCCVVCAYPGWIDDLFGPIKYPSVSGFRFLPALIALAAMWHATKTSSKIHVILSGILGAIACLWSGESLMYTIPPIGFFILVKALIDLDWLFFIRVPFLSLLITILSSALFLAVYSLYFGVVAEPQALFEYAMVYATPGRGEPFLIAFDGWTTFFIGSLAFCYFLARSTTLRAEGNSSAGALFFGYLLCVSTYFISRSHENNIRNLVPWIILAIAISGALLKSQTNRMLARTGTFVICLLLVQFLSLPREARARDIFRDRMKAALELKEPPRNQVPDPLQRYMKQTWPNYAVTVLDEFYFSEPLDMPNTTGYYMGVATLQHFKELHSKERQGIYLTRMLERKPKSLLITPSDKADIVKKFFSDLVAFCSLTELEDRNGWRIFEMQKPH
jgi:hypothetical protein